MDLSSNKLLISNTLTGFNDTNSAHLITRYGPQRVSKKEKYFRDLRSDRPMKTTLSPFYC